MVIDSAKSLRDFVDAAALRQVIYDLAGKVAHSNTVVLFLGEYSPEELAGSPEFSLADGIIELAYEAREPVDRRWLRLRKLRGSAHLHGQAFVHDRRAGNHGLPAARDDPAAAGGSGAGGSANRERDPEARRVDGRRHPRG